MAKQDIIKNKEIIEILSKKDWEAKICVRSQDREEYRISSISERIENGQSIITLDIDI